MVGDSAPQKNPPRAVLGRQSGATEQRPMTRGAQATVSDGPDVGVGHDACQAGYFGGH